MNDEAKRIAERDLYRARLHEHAHCAVADHFAAVGIVAIDPNDQGVSAKAIMSVSFISIHRWVPQRRASWASPVR
jgi:S-adenosylmethionine/arginine decarboxylase-like enzyme